MNSGVDLTKDNMRQLKFPTDLAIIAAEILQDWNDELFVVDNYISKSMLIMWTGQIVVGKYEPAGDSMENASRKTFFWQKIGWSWIIWGVIRYL